MEYLEMKTKPSEFEKQLMNTAGNLGKALNLLAKIVKSVDLPMELKLETHTLLAELKTKPSKIKPLVGK
jgi:hypothetical protein